MPDKQQLSKEELIAFLEYVNSKYGTQYSSAVTNYVRYPFTRRNIAWFSVNDPPFYSRIRSLIESDSSWKSNYEAYQRDASAVNEAVDYFKKVTKARLTYETDILKKKSEAQAAEEYDAIVYKLESKYRDPETGSFYKDPPQALIDSKGLERVDQTQVMLGMPEYGDNQTWLGQANRFNASLQETETFLWDAPGQKPQEITIPKILAPQYKSQLDKATADYNYQKQQEAQNLKADEWQAKYGLQPDVTGQHFTSAAAIEQNAANKQLQANQNLPYGPGKPWVNQEEWNKFRAEQTRLGEQVQREQVFQQKMNQAASLPLQPYDPTKLQQTIQETVGRTSSGNQNLEKYIQQNSSRVISEFEQKFPGATEAWQKAMGQWDFSKMPGFTNLSPAYGTLFNNLYGSKPQEVYNIQRQAAEEAARIGGTKPPEYSNQAIGWESKDPLAVYAENYPWYQEFMKLPATERGYQPKRYAPTTRWM
jgi:hypothetical protein